MHRKQFEGADLTCNMTLLVVGYVHSVCVGVPDRVTDR